MRNSHFSGRFTDTGKLGYLTALFLLVFGFSQAMAQMSPPPQVCNPPVNTNWTYDGVFSKINLVHDEGTIDYTIDDALCEDNIEYRDMGVLDPKWRGVLTSGETYTIDIEGFPYAFSGCPGTLEITSYVTIYIDANRNGKFDLPDEQILLTDTEENEFTETFTIPEVTETGASYRMRIVASSDATNEIFVSGCDQSSVTGSTWGQMLDFWFTIGQPVPSITDAFPSLDPDDPEAPIIFARGDEIGIKPWIKIKRTEDQIPVKIKYSIYEKGNEFNVIYRATEEGNSN
ncbi:MAG: GEVED domain-containing protein, partial [Candidatus Kapaibacterium sp.]